MCPKSTEYCEEEVLIRPAGVEVINTQPVELAWDTRTVPITETRRVTKYIPKYESYDLEGFITRSDTLTDWETVEEDETDTYLHTELYVTHRVQHSAPIYVAAEYGNISIVSGIYPNTENAI